MMKVINSFFEEWNGEGGFFKLVILGIVFYFIEFKFGYCKVWEFFESLGLIVFFWIIYVFMFDEFYNEI